MTTSEGGVDPQIAVLLEGVRQLGPGMDLRELLDRVVEVACGLVGARYGFLGLLGPDDEITDFVLHGISDEEVRRIASPPTGRGVLGLLVDQRVPLRLADISEHPLSVGFPEGHPPMRSFLGVPVLVDDVAYGNLYLTEKAGGEFTDHDAAILEILAQVAGFLIGSVRTRATTETRREWLEAGVALTTDMQQYLDVDESLRLVAQHLRRVAGAGLVAVLRVEEGDINVVALDAEEQWSADIARVLDQVTPSVGRAALEGAAVRGPALDDLCVHVLPMRSWLAPGHFLLAGIPDDTDEGADTDELLSSYAVQAALALDRTQALSDRQEHLLVADRARIARDLHDKVIQRIFATGLQLQGVRRIVVRSEVRATIDQAIAELNTTIREIRTTIFDLSRQDSTSLSDRIRALVEEYVPVLGFTPYVRIRGAVDGVPRRIEEHLLSCVRELLSNVARHAEATSAVVEVELSAGRVLLRVSDDGSGIAPEVSESGLRNLRRRATDLGGDLRVAGDAHGTVAEWTVPLSMGD